MKWIKKTIAFVLAIALATPLILLITPAKETKAASGLVKKTTTMECSVWSKPDTTKESNRVKKIPAGYTVSVYPDKVKSTAGDGKTFYKTAKGSYILCKCFEGSTAAPSQATKNIWSGKVDKTWYTGDRTTYEIYTAEQLAGLSELVRDAAHADRFRGITINLMSDIVLNDTSNWKNWKTSAPKNNWDPIGKVGGPISGYCPFAGVFNGNGHKISGMYVECGEPGGLFCYTSGAVIRDLTIEKSVIISKEDCAGGLIGLCENSYMENIVANSIYVVARGSRWAGAGGLVGRAEQENNISVLSYSLLLSCGIVVNPILWFDPDVAKKPSMYGTYALNCQVNNSEIRSEGKTYEDAAGGIIGGARQAVALYNCIVTNTSFASYTSFGIGGEGSYGGVVGTLKTRGGETVEYKITNCVISNCKRIDKYKGARYDANIVPSV